AGRPRPCRKRRPIWNACARRSTNCPRRSHIGRMTIFPMSDDATPLMRQYREVKRAYSDAIVLFRVGDFYEMFYEDAEDASRLLSIALTSRDKSKADPVPLCGVPHHAATGYIAKLLKAGRTVAVCDQVEDPKFAKGLVRREVTRLYTPGTLIEADLLPPKESNFLAAVAHLERGAGPVLGLAALEPSTGEFWLSELTGATAPTDLLDELARLEPKELLFPSDLPATLRGPLESRRGLRPVPQEAHAFELTRNIHLLTEHFRVASLDGFGCQGLDPAVRAAGAILRYVRETQPTAPLGHIARCQVRSASDAMQFDAATIRNLELVRPLTEHRRDATLLAVIDRTATTMGSRLLRDWILRPLIDPARIASRLDAVDALFTDLPRRQALRTLLGSVQDVARLSSRVSLGTAMPRDLLALKQTVAVMPELRRALGDPQAAALRAMLE